MKHLNDRIFKIKIFDFVFKDIMNQIVFSKHGAFEEYEVCIACNNSNIFNIMQNVVVKTPVDSNVIQLMIEFTNDDDFALSQQCDNYFKYFENGIFSLSDIPFNDYIKQKVGSKILELIDQHKTIEILIFGGYCRIEDKTLIKTSCIEDLMIQMDLG